MAQGRHESGRRRRGMGAAAQGGTGAVDIGRHESRRRRASPGQREAGSSRRRDARSRDLDVGKTAVSVRRGSLLDRDWQVRASSDAARCGAEGGPTASLLPSGAASLLPSGAELTLRMRPRGRGCAADGITGGGGGGSRPGGGGRAGWKRGLNSLIDGFDWLILRIDGRRGRAGTQVAGKCDNMVRKNRDLWRKYFL